MEQQYAVIVNGAVDNVIVAASEFVSVHFPSAIRIDNLTPTPAIGWTYNGTVFAAPIVHL